MCMLFAFSMYYAEVNSPIHYSMFDIGTYLILSIFIGFILGLIGSIIYILFNKKSLGRAGILEDKRLPYTTIAIAIIPLIAYALFIILRIV